MRAFRAFVTFYCGSCVFACKMRFPCAVAAEGALSVLAVRALFAVRLAEGTLAVLTVRALFAVRPAEGALIVLYGTGASHRPPCGRDARHPYGTDAFRRPPCGRSARRPCGTDAFRRPPCGRDASPPVSGGFPHVFPVHPAFPSVGFRLVLLLFDALCGTGCVHSSR